MLDTAGPAEVDARIRMCIGTHLAALTAADPTAGEIRTGDVVIDEGTYTAKIKGRSLDLTFKEFELLKYLAQHPGRVFTRAQLLQEIWGYDYFGGSVPNSKPSSARFATLAIASHFLTVAKRAQLPSGSNRYAPYS
jgi:hypothetical protein